MNSSAAPEVRPVCHPDRRLAHRTKRLCLECALDLKAARRGIQRLGAIPGPVPGVEQRAFITAPHACLHCGKRSALVLEGRELHCVGGLGGCGWTAYRVSSTAPSPRHTNPQRYSAKGALVGLVALILTACATPAPLPPLPQIAAPLAIECRINGELRSCRVLLSEDYLKLEAALCAGRKDCELGR